jgi:hypothetical protein
VSKIKYIRLSIKRKIIILLLLLFVIEMGSHSVVQAGLEHMGLVDYPTSVSPFSGTTVMAHHTGPVGSLK